MHIIVCIKEENAYEMRSSDWDSAACSSDLGGREPHRSVHGLSPIHGAKQRAVAEMTTHQPQLVRPTLQKLRSAQADVAVRRPVEAEIARGTGGERVCQYG